MNKMKIQKSILRYACIYLSIFLFVLVLLLFAKDSATTLAYENVIENINNQISRGLSDWESLLSSSRNCAYILQDDPDIVKLSLYGKEDMKNQIPLVLRAKDRMHNNWLLLSEQAIDVILCYEKSDFVITGHFVDSSINTTYGSLISFDGFTLDEWQQTFKSDLHRVIVSQKMSMKSAYMVGNKTDVHLVTYKLYRDTTVLGYFSLVISNDYLCNLFLPYPVEENQFFAFYTPDGKVIYSTYIDFPYVGGMIGERNKVEYQGQKYTILSEESETGYRLAVAISDNDIASKVSQLVLLFRLYLGFGIVCFVIFTVYLSFFHLHPLNKLLCMSRNANIQIMPRSSTYSYLSTVLNSTIDSCNNMQIKLKEETEYSNQLLLESACMRSIYTQREHEQLDRILTAFSPTYRVVLLSIDHEQQALCVQAIAEIQEVLSKQGKLYSFNSLPHERVIIIGSQVPADMIVKTICTRIKSEIYDFNLSVGMSAEGSDCAVLHTLFIQARNRVAPFLTLPMITISEDAGSIANESLLIEIRSLTLLINLILSGHREDIESFFESLIERAKPFIGTEPYHELICILCHTLKEAAVNLNCVETPPSNLSMLNVESKPENLKALMEYCLFLCDSVKKKNVSIDYKALWDYISLNVSDTGLSAKSIGDKLGYSEKYVYSLVKQLTGQTVSAVIESIRLGKACEYLKDTDLNIEAICELTGFGTKNTFFRVFKKQFGMTPGTWRDAQKQHTQNDAPKQAGDTNEQE